MIIGLNGKIGAGKDTVGAHLIQKYSFERVSFAAPLKESFAALFDVPVSFIETFKSDPECLVGMTVNYQRIAVVMTMREALQRYGTEAHRDVFGSDFWVEHAFAQIPVTDAGNYCFTDARFANELQAIRKRGGINVQIIRPGHDGDGHASEAEPPAELIDHVIINDGTLDTLYDAVDELLGRLR